MIRQYELVERVRAYDPSVNEALLNQAYVFSMKAHGTQKRASGDPYFSHPLEVAGILTDMHLDSDTIATALLHDTIEDTLATTEEIRTHFGSKVAELVDGVTKLSKLELQAERTRQAENFRKFLLAMSNDIRVLLVKLADRLHNMRTLEHIRKPEKRRRIAVETLEIYAPLAARIGMHDIKDELEDLAFAQVEPEARSMLLQRIDRLRADNPDLIPETSEALRLELSEKGVDADVTGREKRPYSIWKKIERSSRSFEQMSDLVAFRIIVDSVEDCYRALGIVHGRWRAVPGRFKDYISLPKRNGYRSIHTCLIGPVRRPIEIQIRTRQMHRESEMGVAAHWRYKEGGVKPVDGSQYAWLRELLEILESAASPEEFLENTKLAMFHDQVFAFTPKGDLISLPKGSTIVDFAYAVHTEVGDRCVGAKANGRVVPLRYQLNNGDQIEVLTSDKQAPSAMWEGFVVTGKARAAIRRAVRSKRQGQYADLGKGLVRRACRRNQLDYRDKAIRQAAGKLGYSSFKPMMAAVGEGKLSAGDVVRAAFPGATEINGEQSDAVPALMALLDEDLSERVLPITGVIDDLHLTLAPCCQPVPGDRIIGVLDERANVVIHRIDCSQAPINTPDSDRWLDLGWSIDRPAAELYPATVRLEVVNDKGALAEITAMVARYDVSISNLDINSIDRVMAEVTLEILVRDIRHLATTIAALGTLGVVSLAERITP